MYIRDSGAHYCCIFPAAVCVCMLLLLTVLFCVSFAGLCPDWETWDPVKPVENATEAMQLADDWLGIPQVRSPPLIPACFFFSIFIFKIDLDKFDINM